MELEKSEMLALTFMTFPFPEKMLSILTCLGFKYAAHKDTLSSKGVTVLLLLLLLQYLFCVQVTPYLLLNC